MQYCSSCGKSIEDQASFCPFCGHEVKPAAVPQPPAAEAQSPQAQRSVSAKPPEVQLTADQIQAGDRGLAAAALNFLFWGVGYFQAGVKRPFGRTWLLCPLVYVIYAFVGQLFFFTPLLAGESTIQTTIPTGNGTSIPITTTGYNPYPSLLTKDLEILAFLVPGIILGLFLARDVYRRIASSYGDPPRSLQAEPPFATSSRGRLTR